MNGLLLVVLFVGGAAAGNEILHAPFADPIGAASEGNSSGSGSGSGNSSEQRLKISDALYAYHRRCSRC